MAVGGLGRRENVWEGQMQMWVETGRVRAEKLALIAGLFGTLVAGRN